MAWDLASQTPQLTVGTVPSATGLMSLHSAVQSLQAMIAELHPAAPRLGSAEPFLQALLMLIPEGDLQKGPQSTLGVQGAELDTGECSLQS